VSPVRAGSAPLKPGPRFVPTPVQLAVVKAAAETQAHHLPYQANAKTVRGLVMRDLAVPHYEADDYDGCPCRWWVLTPRGVELAGESCE
jgi:hypothetical protein